MRFGPSPAPGPSPALGPSPVLPPLLMLALLLAPVTAPAQEGYADPSSGSGARGLPLAPIESNNYLAYTDFPEMQVFLERLAGASAELSVDTLALLPGERQPGESEAPALLLVSLSRAAVQDGGPGSPRASVLIIGSQHGDEQSGKEAALRIVRDLATGPLNPLLDALDVFVVPMANPWGTATGQRENASGLDLNRDHIRLRSAVTAGLHSFFAEHRPDVVIDLHELGPAAYDAEIGLATQPNADSALIKLGRYRIMPYVVNELAHSGFSFHEYVLAMPEPGTGSEEVERYFTYGPLLASYARNAFALRGSVSMLFEVASSREIHDLDRRTSVQYTALRAALEVIAGTANEVREETSAARRVSEDWIPVAAGGDSSGVASQPFVLRATYERDPRHPSLTWLVREPEGINTGTTDRWKPAIRPILLIDRPAGYLIHPDESELIATLLRHDIRLSVLTESRRILLGRYPEGLPAPVRDSLTEAGFPPARADRFILWSREVVPAGTVYLDLRQPASPLIMAIVEPWSQDSWFADVTPGPGSGRSWYPVSRLEQPITDGLRTVPPAGSATGRRR